MMERRIGGVSLKDRKRGESLRHLMCRKQDLESKVEIWFGHVERKEENDWVK